MLFLKFEIITYNKNTVLLPVFFSQENRVQYEDIIVLETVGSPILYSTNHSVKIRQSVFEASYKSSVNVKVILDLAEGYMGYSCAVM